MDWLRPAVALMGLSTAALAAAFFYVWRVHGRRTYVLLWAFSWLCALPHLGITAGVMPGPEDRVFWGLDLFFVMATALLMAAGCFTFVNRRTPPRRLAWIALPFLLWPALGPLITRESPLLLLPSSLLLGGTYLWTSTLFLGLRRTRGTPGAGWVSILFALSGLHELDYPLLAGLSWGAPAGYALASVLTIGIALSLLIMVLEETLTEVNQERTRLRTILDHLPVGVIVTRPDGRVLLANAVIRAMVPRLGRPEAHAAATESETLLLPDGAPCPESELPLRRALASTEALPVREFRLRAAEGLGRAVLVDASPLHDERGERLGAVAIYQDIEEINRIREEMTRGHTLRSLGTLAAGLAHDFNNALTLVQGHVDLAARATRDPLVREPLELLRRVVNDSAASVRRIQSVARAQKSGPAAAFDLALATREALEVTRPRWRDEAQARGIDYQIQEAAPEGLWIAGQAPEMREALMNLALNAFDAMPRGGTLRIEGEAREGRVWLRVRDDGVGMTPEVARRAFDPFFTTKGDLGTGLGLAIVYGVVQRHGGEISVETAPGHGACFTLSFPLATPPDPAPEAAAPAVARSLKVLVVDDEQPVGRLCATLLETGGHSTLVAEDGPSALALVRTHHPDVVMTDLGMPGMNGWDLSAALREEFPQLPIILVTGWGDMLDPQKVVAHGIVRILTKPYGVAELLESVAAVTTRAATGP